MQKFINLGCDVTVAAPRDELFVHQKHAFKFHPLHHLKRRGLNPIHEILFLIELILLFRRNRPDLVFLYTIKPNIFGSIAASLCRIKSVNFITGLGFAFTNQGLLQKLVISLFKMARRFSDRFVFLNEFDKKEFQNFEIINKYDPRNLVFPGEGVDISSFDIKRYQESSISSRNGTDFFKFAFVGRLLRDKGILLYCNAAEKIKLKYPSTEFLVIGPFDPGNPMGISREELEQHISENHIKYLGPTSDVRNYLAVIDALIVPTSYGEGLSRVALESLSMSKPVIATRNRGITPLVIDGATGLLADEGSLEDLVLQIENFIKLPVERIEEMSRQARIRVESRFDMDTVISRYIDLTIDLFPERFPYSRPPLNIDAI